jgi:hypothetical protein
MRMNYPADASHGTSMVITVLMRSAQRLRRTFTQQVLVASEVGLIALTPWCRTDAE